MVITEGCKSDVRVAQSMDLNAGSIIAMDRDHNAVSGRDRAISSPTNSSASHAPRRSRTARIPLRRTVLWDAVNEREIVLLTNLLHFGPTMIAAIDIAGICKCRWEIECSSMPSS